MNTVMRAALLRQVRAIRMAVVQLERMLLRGEPKHDKSPEGEGELIAIRASELAKLRREAGADDAKDTD